jgi:cytochrome oxidase Cu insertion factor (SCO1/SenC/PrrC family)
MGKRRLTRQPSGKGKQRPRFHWKTWVYLGVIALALVGLVAYMIMQAPGATAKVGQTAPDFTLSLLNGQKITLSSLRGRPVLVDFWSSA